MKIYLQDKDNVKILGLLIEPSLTEAQYSWVFTMAQYFLNHIPVHPRQIRILNKLYFFKCYDKPVIESISRTSLNPT